MKPSSILFLLLLVVVASGCDSEPTMTQVSGKITKDGQPINRVEVRFVPLNEKHGKFIASGLSDDEGNFVIGVPGREEALCPIGQCKVTVREGPMPAELRGRLETADRGNGGGNDYKKYKASLRHRPIPRKYERLHSTPLIFDVTKDKADGYDIDM